MKRLESECISCLGGKRCSIRLFGVLDSHFIFGTIRGNFLTPILFFIILPFYLAGQDEWKDQLYEPLALPQIGTDQIGSRPEDPKPFWINIEDPFSTYPINLNHQTNAEQPFVDAIFFDSRYTFSGPIYNLGGRFSDPVLVDNELAGSSQKVVKLFIITDTGERLSCTGTLIDAEHVLTTCHCVFFENDGGWPTQIEVVPAYQNGQAPYGSAMVSQILAWESWTKAKHPAWDIAVLKLDQPIGVFPGWMSLGQSDRLSFYQQSNFYNISYPAQNNFSGGEWYSRNGQFDQAHIQGILYHQKESFSGQNGSANFIEKSNGQQEIISILSHGVAGETARTGHVRMDSTKISAIEAFMDIGMSDSLDIALYIEPNKIDTIYNGRSLDDLRLRVFNESDFNGYYSFVMEVFLQDQNQQRNVISTIKMAGTDLAARQAMTIDFNQLNYRVQGVVDGNFQLGARIMLQDADTLNNVILSEEPIRGIEELSQDNFYLDVAAEEAPINATGGEIPVVVETNDELAWSIFCTADWVIWEQEFGRGTQEFNLKIQPHINYKERTAELVIIAKGEEQRLSIQQLGFRGERTDTIALVPGWNLVSTDVLPYDSSFSTLLASLQPNNLVSVEGMLEDRILNYHLNDNRGLQHWQCGAGYWIKVKEADTLNITGIAAPDNYRLPLQTGRNLMAYIPQQQQKISDFFAEEINNNSLQFIVAHKEGKSYRYEPGASNNKLEYLQNGFGYWVEIQEPQSTQLIDISENEILVNQPAILSPFSTAAIDIILAPDGNTLKLINPEAIKGRLGIVVLDRAGSPVVMKELIASNIKEEHFNVDLGYLSNGPLLLCVFWDGELIGKRLVQP